MTKQVEALALWQLKKQGFNRAGTQLRIGRTAYALVLEWEKCRESLRIVKEDTRISYGLMNSLGHQDKEYIIVEVKDRWGLRILRHYRIAGLRISWRKTHQDKANKLS